MDVIYSIGHSNHTEELFISLLQKHKADLVLDVRSSPYSQRFPQFNREVISKTLLPHRIDYQFFGEWFGARQPDKAYYTSARWLNYILFTKSLIFKEGVNRLDTVLQNGKTPALMCAEKDPFDCHRAIMVCRALSLMGYEIRHILADGSIQTQAELDTRLLDKYFPRRNEGSIFDLIEGEKDTQTLITEAYYKRNEAIAWRMEGTEEQD